MISMHDVLPTDKFHQFELHSMGTGTDQNRTQNLVNGGRGRIHAELVYGWRNQTRVKQSTFVYDSSFRENQLRTSKLNPKPNRWQCPIARMPFQCSNSHCAHSNFQNSNTASGRLRHCGWHCVALLPPTHCVLPSQCMFSILNYLSQMVVVVVHWKTS